MRLSLSSRLLVGCFFSFAIACGDETAASPAVTAPTNMRVVAGTTQTAHVSDTLPDGVRIVVTDDAGHPLPEVRVNAAVTRGEGTLLGSELWTREDGSAVFRWVLGPVTGPQTLEIRVDGLDPVVVRATGTGCELPECPEYGIAEGTLQEVDLATYELSGQVVHPDVVVRPGTYGSPWLWMAITPYPEGNPFYENPSLFRSLNGRFWRVPRGVVNPVAWPGADSYLSDPDIVLDESSRTLWLYYREVAGDENRILVKRSADGMTWGEPDTVVTMPSHRAISPAVVHPTPQAPWTMWVVDAGPEGCDAEQTTVQRRTSPDGLHWTPAEPTNLAQPGKIIWHLDVTWVAARSEYWALYTTYPKGSNCVTRSLYFATSPDGITWAPSTAPIYRVGSNPIFRDVLYRSTMLPSADGSSATLWLSGANYEGNAYHWKAGTVRQRTSDLLRISHGPAPLDVRAPGIRMLPPPEPNDVRRRPDA